MRGRGSGFGWGLDRGVVALVEMALVGLPPFPEDRAVIDHILGQHSVGKGECPMPDFRAELWRLTEETDD